MESKGLLQCDTNTPYKNNNVFYLHKGITKKRVVDIDRC